MSGRYVRKALVCQHINSPTTTSIQSAIDERLADVEDAMLVDVRMASTVIPDVEGGHPDEYLYIVLLVDVWETEPAS